VGGGALLAVLTTTPLVAQLESLPVYGDGATAGLWAVWLDAGSGVNNASGQAHHLGARVSGGVGRLTLSVGVGLWDTGSGASATVGGTAGVRLLGGTASPLAVGLLMGVGYARAGPDSASSTYVTAPVGLAIMFNRVHVAGQTIVPWVAPRGEVDRVRFPGVEGDQGGLGLSAGVRAPLSGRVGVHAALDWLELFQRRQNGITFVGGSRVTAGLGVHVFLAPPRPGR
jgi:hypothetical protein